jgi:endonuclease I
VAKKRKARSRKKRKKNFGLRKKIFWLLFAITLVSIYFTQDVSTNYYDTNKLEGLKGASLKTAIHDLIRDHKYLNFDEKTTARYWWENYFIKTDWHPDRYYWDMYSNQKHSSYIGGNIQNREHCMPRSWWGKKDKYSSYDANGDLHNLFPSDYAANSAKSNLPLGEVGVSQFDNGSCKVGLNTYPNGYRGQVFEPANEYKGDFARVYFYMVTCYEDYGYNWRNDATKSMLQKGTYPVFQNWAIEMLLKWHRNDPVSEKEIKRNEQVYRLQNNRNPFVDDPDLVEYIWGNKRDKAYTIDNINKIQKKQNKFRDIIYDYRYKIEKLINTFYL